MIGVESSLDLNGLADKRLRELLVDLVEKQAHGVVVLDQKGRVLVWNGWMGDWTGIASAQALGRPWKP